MKKWLILVGSLLIVANVKADLRVLFRFDASGHFVHRIFPVASRQQLAIKKLSALESPKNIENSAPPFQISSIDRGRSWQNAAVSEGRRKQIGPVDGFVRLAWFDLSGNELVQTELPDPRVVHSPSHAEGINASRNGLTEGAWLASGPDSAVSVTISLPESTILGLAAEFWILELLH